MWLNSVLSLKLLSKRFKNFGGRNSSGRITVRRRGGGFKFKHTVIDYWRPLLYISAIVLKIETSKSHSSHLALISYSCGVLSYIVAPEGLKSGDIVTSGFDIPPTLGSCLPLRQIPFNIKIHNIESRPLSGAKYLRSAGSWGKILEKRKSKALVLFNNGHKKLISLESFATIGQVSNSGYKKRNKKFKAGDSRKSGIRPHVRGVVMNPIDHPHGGGKGKKSPPSSIYNFVRLLPKNRKTTFKKNHF